MQTLFDKDKHWLVPGEDFTAPAVLVITDWEEGDDEDLSAYELPTLIPVFEEMPPKFPTKTTKSPMPYAEDQQAWGGMCLAFNAMAAILGGKAEAFQHNTYDAKNAIEQPQFSFEFKPGAIWHYQGGKL